MVTEKGSASWPGIAGFECFKFCLVWGVEQLYIHVPLYRCTSMYIGRGQVLFQNLFLTYSPPILGRSDDEICVMHKSRFWLISRPSSPKNEPPCSSLSYKFAGANLLLLGTSGIRAASAFPALLKIDIADARSLAEIKRRRTFCTSSIYFGVATTQMRCIFSKVYLYCRL